MLIVSRPHPRALAHPSRRQRRGLLALLLASAALLAAGCTSTRPPPGVTAVTPFDVQRYLLVDEADNIMRYEFDVLRKLLLQGREFGTGVILASQYLRHFKTSTTDYRDPLLTWFIHKVPNVTPAELGALGFTSDLGDLSERVKTLPNHHCLYKTSGVAGEVIRGLPFYELEKGRPRGT